MADAESFYKPEEAICNGDGREERLMQFIQSHPDYSKMRGSPSTVLSAIDEFAQTQDFLMNVGKFKGSIVSQYIASHRPKLMVELGGYIGYSAIMFGAAARVAGGERYLSLEIKPAFAAVARSLIALAGLDDFVHVITAPCSDSLRQLALATPRRAIDLLFIDHQKSAYLGHLMLCEELSLIRPGTCIIADNVIRPGAPLYLDYVRGPYKEKTDIRRIAAQHDDEFPEGKPELIYDTRLCHSLEPSGEADGLEVSVCQGSAFDHDGE
ncbi:hypothetical protein CDD82_5897 [Ophiocordyceps australis]|uniref:catechol O-methyltransferase n=1 Tax=Ophiocordyceps australis TaxID=1399860 RepID=A0A2C5YSU3_9HYPO|nr:hypothetical protein CDD82_5897 [Ophiocordyceps australis]